MTTEHLYGARKVRFKGDDRVYDLEGLNLVRATIIGLGDPELYSGDSGYRREVPFTFEVPVHVLEKVE